MSIKGLSNIKITEICSNHFHTKPYFRGVYGSNKLSELEILDNPPFFVICNTLSDKENISGHWTIIFRNENYTSHFFCSLGKKPEGEILKFIERLGGDYAFNVRRYQAYGSASCGEMVCYYADMRCQGYNDAEVLAQFSTTNLAINDCLVMSYVYGHMTAGKKHISR